VGASLPWCTSGTTVEQDDGPPSLDVLRAACALSGTVWTVLGAQAAEWRGNKHTFRWVKSGTGRNPCVGKALLG
jgi:hypothetical protein